MSTRHIIIVAILLFLPLLIIAQPKVEWIAASHDFGVINENDGDAVCEFKMVNVGTEPLVITKARATCGCTTPRYDADPIAPGDTATVRVSYDPVGRPGRFKKKIYIDTNDNDNQRSTLVINGVVIAAEQTVKVRYPVDAGVLKLQRGMVAIGELYKGKAKTAFVDAYNQSSDTIYPQWLNVPDYLMVMSAPKAVPPGEQVTFTFYANSLKCSEWGLIEDTITVVPTNGAIGLPVYVSTIIKEDFSKLTPGQRMNAPAIAISSQRIDSGVIARENGKITKEIEIENFGKSPLELRRVYTTDEGIELVVEKEKIKKGKKGKIYVTIDPSKVSQEYINARITIISNDPDRSHSVVRVVAEIK